MGRLSSEQVLKENKTTDSASIVSLTLTHKALSDVSCLAEFKNLEKLDLKFNNLTSLEGLKECSNLKWLSVVQNKLQSLKGIEGLTKLTVLNAGKNNITSMDEVQNLVNLRALIMNDNEIESICRLDCLKELNTIVLSRNPIRKLSLDKVKSITKISLSNCRLESIDTSIKVCGELKELRLAHNEIKTIPAELARNTKLQNLDLGNNVITHWSDLKVLASLQNLKNFNLQGNPIAEKDKLVKKIKKLVPGLQIFNAKPIEKYFKKEKCETIEDPSIAGGNDDGASKKKKTQRDHDVEDKILSLEGQKEETASKKKKRERDTGVEDKNLILVEQKEDFAFKKKKSDRTPKEVDKSSGKREHGKKKHAKELMMSDQDDTNNGEKDGKAGKKSKKAREHNAKETSAQEANGITRGKLPKRKVENIIDDNDNPFAEVMTTDRSSNLEHRGELKNGGTTVQNPDYFSALIVEPTKREKSKKLHAASSELQLLAQESEVGLGGPSAWGDD